MLADLKKSNLSPAHAKLLRLEPFAEGHNLGLPLNWAGYKLPYFTPEGKVNGFFRFRLLQTQPSTGWRAITVPPEKPLRYLQPKDSEVHIYLPPLKGSSWRKVMEDPTIPVCITEGEKKAACATLYGVMPTVGLGGVYNWQSRRLRQTFLPILEEFQWAQRHVFICYDSDVIKNPMVRIAQSQLGGALLQRGAIIHNVAMPVPKDGGKCALDDFIVQHGVEEAEQLLIKTRPDEASEEVHGMNSEFAVLRDTAEVVALEDGSVLSANKFADVVYKNRKYVTFVIKDEKETPKVHYTAKEWLDWPHRLTLARLQYSPGQEQIAGDCYNTWQGWGCTPSSKGSIQPWEDLIDLLLRDAKPDHIAWMKRWFAYPIIHPGTKLYTATILWSTTQGNGKTLLGDTMRRIYGKNYGTVNNVNLASQYNDWVVNKQFIVGDEISTGNKRTVTDGLKDVITRDHVNVSIKYRAQFTVRDCANYYFTSNHPDAFFIDDADRRYFVHEVVAQPKEAEFYERYTKWLDHEGGAARLFQHLLDTDVSEFNPRGHAPLTSSKIAMIMDSKSDLGDWCMRLKAEPDKVLVDRGGKPLGHALWTSQDLLRIYDPEGSSKVTANGLAREMKRSGFRYAAGGNNTGVVDGARTRFWALRHTDKMNRQGPATLARLYQEERDAMEAKKFERRRVN